MGDVAPLPAMARRLSFQGTARAALAVATLYAWLLQAFMAAAFAAPALPAGVPGWELCAAAGHDGSPAPADRPHDAHACCLGAPPAPLPPASIVPAPAPAPILFRASAYRFGDDRRPTGSPDGSASSRGPPGI